MFHGRFAKPLKLGLENGRRKAAAPVQPLEPALLQPQPRSQLHRPLLCDTFFIFIPCASNFDSADAEDVNPNKIG
jgi:hypothetical protein